LCRGCEASPLRAFRPVFFPLRSAVTLAGVPPSFMLPPFFSQPSGSGSLKMCMISFFSFLDYIFVDERCDAFPPTVFICTTSLPVYFLALPLLSLPRVLLAAFYDD